MKKISILLLLIFSASASEIYDTESYFNPQDNLIDQKLYEIYKRDKPEKKVIKCTKMSLDLSAVIGTFMSFAHGFGQVIGTVSNFESRGGYVGSSGPACKTIQHRMNFQEFKKSININIGSLKVDQQFSQDQFKDIALILMESQKSSYIDELKIEFHKLVSIYEEYYSCQALGEISISENKKIKQLQRDLINLLRDETQKLEILASQKQGISIIELRDSIRNVHVPYFDLDDEEIDRMFQYDLSQELSIAIELEEACNANDQQTREVLITTAVDKVLNKSNLGKLKNIINKQVFVHTNYQNALRSILTKDCL
ncbi:MAG: hypothetical protein VX341_08750 [Bdellovibrionota bacterium]|nr:hypothetical protein [Bdellovibrionota bacterium]